MVIPNLLRSVKYLDDGKSIGCDVYEGKRPQIKSGPKSLPKLLVDLIQKEVEKKIVGGCMHWRQVDMMRAWTGMAPLASCRHASVRVTPVHSSHINMYFSDFVTCISLILQTIFLRFLKTVISHIMTWTGMAPGPAGAGTSES